MAFGGTAFTGLSALPALKLNTSKVLLAVTFSIIVLFIGPQSLLIIGEFGPPSLEILFRAFLTDLGIFF